MLEDCFLEGWRDKIHWTKPLASKRPWSIERELDIQSWEVVEDEGQVWSFQTYFHLLPIVELLNEWFNQSKVSSSVDDDKNSIHLQGFGGELNESIVHISAWHTVNADIIYH